MRSLIADLRCAARELQQARTIESVVAEDGSQSRSTAAPAREKPVARANYVSPECFPLLRIPVVQGRLWSRDDTVRGASLAVIQPVCQ